MADLGNGDGKSSSKAVGGLSKVPNASKSPKPVKTCQQQTVVHHAVVVRARWQDTRADVPAVKCQILLGTAVIHPGPLANGTLAKAGIVGGNYEVTLPEVDSEEWDFE